MAVKPRTTDAARAKPLSNAMLRLRSSRRARLQCCAFTVVAAAIWLTRRLWADRVAGLRAAEQVPGLRPCRPPAVDKLCTLTVSDQGATDETMSIKQPALPHQWRCFEPGADPSEGFGVETGTMRLHTDQSLPSCQDLATP